MVGALERRSPLSGLDFWTQRDMNTPASEITLLVSVKPSLVDPLLTLFAVPYGSIDNDAQINRRDLRNALGSGLESVQSG
jgi:hypothetical protein